MGTDYRLDVYDTSGALQAVVTDMRGLAYRRRVGFPGLLMFSLDGSHSVLSTLADKWQVEVWRKVSGGSWGRDFTGLLRGLEWFYGERGRKAVASCPGLMSVLGWRIVNWHAGTEGMSRFTGEAAETIMKGLVEYNCAASATVANGRLREGAISGLSVEADGANGETVDWFCAYDNVLDSLQELRKVAGGDYDLVKTSATTWEFRWYTGQLGTDRSATVLFAMERGNMRNPVYVESRSGERTAATVGGQGEEGSRMTSIRTGANYDVDDNNIEMFVHATDVSTAEGLEARGDARLAEMEALVSFGFEVLQTPACAYGTHYTLGDKVTAVNPFTGASVTMKVEAVEAGMNEEGEERVEVGLEAV